MSEHRREGYRTPRDIVVNAMQDAPWALVQHHLRLEGVQTLTRSELDLRYVTSTFLACREVCASVLGELVQYPALFPKVAIVRAEASDVIPFKKKAYTEGHEYFIAQDVDEIWYAGSPANHTQYGNSPLGRLYTSRNPQELLDDIQDREGGIWVDAAYVEDVFAVDSFSPQRIDTNGGSRLRYLQITMTRDEGPVTYMREAELYTVDPAFMPSQRPVI